MHHSDLRAALVILAVLIVTTCLYLRLILGRVRRLSEPVVGWGWPRGSYSWHAFREHRSLCGEWGIEADAELEPAPPRDSYRCPRCRARWAILNAARADMTDNDGPVTGTLR